MYLVVFMIKSFIIVFSTFFTIGIALVVNFFYNNIR